MEATVAEIKAIMPPGSITDAEIQDLINIATADVGSSDHSVHLNRTLQLAVTKLKLAGVLPDSATVGQVKQETNISKILDQISTADSVRKQLNYYRRA